MPSFDKAANFWSIRDRREACKYFLPFIKNLPIEILKPFIFSLTRVRVYVLLAVIENKEGGRRAINGN